MAERPYPGVRTKSPMPWRLAWVLFLLLCYFGKSECLECAPSTLQTLAQKDVVLAALPLVTRHHTKLFKEGRLLWLILWATL